MKLHVVYRAAPGSGKNRPERFSKAMCLLSFLQAVDAAEASDRPVQVTFLLDGDLPQVARALMQSRGQVVELGGVGNSGSYVEAIRIAVAGDPDDVVYLVEDDYLHMPSALQVFGEACVASPDGLYFTLYDHPDRHARDDDLRTVGRSVEWIAGHHWVAVESSAMTFGSRRATLQADTMVLQAAARFTSYPHDRAMWRTLQGLGLRAPLRWARRQPRRLVSAVPALATHVEVGLMSPGVDWVGLVDGLLRDGDRELLGLRDVW